MATTVVSTYTSGTNLNYTFGTAGDFFILTEGTQLVADGYSNLFGTAAGINVTIDGYLWLQGVDGAGFGSPFYFSGNDTINIGENAVVNLISGSASGWGGIMLGQNSIGGTIFNNQGSITLGGGSGFYVGGGNNLINNFGSITLGYGNIRLGTGDRLTNTGTISSQDDAGIVGNAGLNVVINRGLIVGSIFLDDGTDYFDGIGGIVTGTVNLGAGDDYYRVSDAAILLEEALGQGFDTVESTVDFALGSNFENLTLLGAAKEGVGNDLGNAIVGNAFANILRGEEESDELFGGAGDDIIYGGDGDDSLVGGSGDDKIFGGEGADTYSYAAGDTLVEYAGEGTDTVYSSISYTLVANIERLVLENAANINGTGNALANLINGNSGNNTLIGGLGVDTLNGGVGADRFQYNSSSEGRDLITNFESADFMVFKGSAFGGLTTANKAAGFVSRATSNLAVDASDRLIFRQSDDTLWYDSNGSTAGGTKIMIADFSNNFNLTASDILIV